MQKILFISPPSIAGELIIKGFANGFKSLGHETLICDVRHLNSKVLSAFQPDFAFGYCYAHLVSNQAFDAIQNSKIRVIHYFADDPFSKFAHSGNLELIQTLKSTNPLVFLWDKNFSGAFGSNSHYLPLGIDLDSYKVSTNEILYDISFVGRPLTQKRQSILAQIIKNFPNKLNIFCFEKHFERSVEEMSQLGLLVGEDVENYKKSYKGFLRTEQDLAKVYNSSKINLNITEQGLGSLNYRVFEVLASKGFLLTDEMSELEDYFVKNQDYVSYETSDAAVMLIKSYLNESTKRQHIASCGFEKVKSAHSFVQRAKEILNIITF